MVNPKSKADFKAVKYSLALESMPPKLRIIGKKIGKPSKRITLFADKVKVIDAQLSATRKNITYEYQIKRINHLPSFGEIRVHTHDTLYPGDYTLQLGLQGNLSDIHPEDTQALLPLADKLDAGDETKFELSYTDD